MDIKLIKGDSLEKLKLIESNSVDSICTDAPYGLNEIKDLEGLIQSWIKGEHGDEYQGKGFMSKHWDIVPSPQIWKEAFRVLKPGGYLLCFAGTRTQDLMSLAMRLAGFKIKDTLMFMYGSGFPKSTDISKSLDKAAGAEREVIGRYQPPGMDKPWNLTKAKDERTVEVFASSRNNLDITAPATEEAKKFDGWGTALKPSWEPIILGQKPIEEKTIIKNVIKHGTGGINIDDCRIESQNKESKGRFPANTILFHSDDCKCIGTKKVKGTSTGNGNASKVEEGKTGPLRRGEFVDRTDEDGYETVEAWECVDDCPIKLIDEQSGNVKFGSKKGGYTYADKEYNVEGFVKNCKPKAPSNYGDAGGASRFFYTSKSSRKERNEGLPETLNNNHPTVKPITLMRYLVRLITPKNGVVLDCFMGSGTTGIACVREGFSFIGIELDEDEKVPSMQIARARIEYALKETGNSDVIIE